MTVGLTFESFEQACLRRRAAVLTALARMRSASLLSVTLAGVGVCG